MYMYMEGSWCSSTVLAAIWTQIWMNVKVSIYIRLSLNYQAHSANKNALMCSLDLIRFPIDGWSHCYDKYTRYNTITDHTLYAALLCGKCAASADFNIIHLRLCTIPHTQSKQILIELVFPRNVYILAVIAILWEPCMYIDTYIWTFVWALISSYGLLEIWAQSRMKI